jgi:hypothetical protein
MVPLNPDDNRKWQAAQRAIAVSERAERETCIGPAEDRLGKAIHDITEGEETPMEETIQIERRKCGDHKMFEDEIKTLREDVKILRGRPSWLQTFIISSLAALVGIFGALYFSNSGLLNQVAGKQAMVLVELASQKEEIRRMQELVVRNAGALDSLSSRMGGKP